MEIPVAAVGIFVYSFIWFRKDSIRSEISSAKLIIHCSYNSYLIVRFLSVFFSLISMVLWSPYIGSYHYISPFLSSDSFQLRSSVCGALGLYMISLFIIQDSFFTSVWISCPFRPKSYFFIYILRYMQNNFFYHSLLSRSLTLSVYLFLSL